MVVICLYGKSCIALLSPHLQVTVAADQERHLRHWVLSASCHLLYTRRLAACRLPMLVHGQEIPMELWCYIGLASVGTVCLALTDTKQWVLFYCPGQGQAWYC